ncbi:unnamed protein product [Cylicocyclus nassatus]|uniref:G-protein coupled receptors family 1 profile domain-containing protein n=1 Tax=Cylicocyclus nassatus TaxID=53992 RepID=A0AA36H4A9_CYLNA|nr:unnamed protein product [Cylicocyclus nassatus]
MSSSLSSAENVADSVIVATMSTLGTFSNFLASITILCNPVRKNPFCTLCLSHTMASLGVSLAFFYVTSITLRQAELSTPLIEKIMGQFTMFFWNATVLSHLAISLNRVVAIASPFKAIQLFTRKRTMYMVLSIWCLAFCQTVPFFWRASCYIYYDRSKWKWRFSDGLCGKFFLHCERSKILILIITLISDVVALVKYIKYIKITSESTIFMNNEAQKKLRIEVKFFKQVFKLQYFSNFN